MTFVLNELNLNQRINRFINTPPQTIQLDFKLINKEC